MSALQRLGTPEKYPSNILALYNSRLGHIRAVTPLSKTRMSCVHTPCVFFLSFHFSEKDERPSDLMI